MISKGIVIFWDGGTEFIPIDCNSISEQTVITRTIERLKSNKKFVSYSTTSCIKKEGETYILTLNYKHHLNTHIAKDDVCWGRSEIHINSGEVSGEACWHDDHKPEERNGITTWKIIDSSLYKKPAKEIISRLKRNQTALRQALIVLGASCAITGETTIAALEAAHIIPSVDLGSEVIENSILLRADIHKLFDKNLFSISKSGDIHGISEELSEEYRNLLVGKRLTQESFERVKMAICAALELKIQNNKISA